MRAELRDSVFSIKSRRRVGETADLEISRTPLARGTYSVPYDADEHECICEEIVVNYPRISRQ
jgi:hypothetical protein